MGPVTRCMLLTVSLCALGATGCTKTYPGYVYTPELATSHRLWSLLGSAQMADRQRLRVVQSYDEFRALFPAEQAPSESDAWGNPFVLQRAVLPNEIRLTITSTHHSPKFPLKIEIVIPAGDAPITGFME